MNILVHLAITAATVYGAYLMMTKMRAEPQPKREVVVKAPVNRLQPRVTPSRPQAPKWEPHQETPEPEPPPAPDLQAIHSLPETLSLPSSKDSAITKLADIPEVGEIELLSHGLTLAGSKVLLGETLIAGLRNHEGTLEFRWSEDPPSEAEAALRNSLIRVSEHGAERIIPLRSPVHVLAPKWNTEEALQRIKIDCECLPPLEDVRFAFDGHQSLPPFKLDGNLDEMKIGDEAYLHYQSCNAATRVYVKKTGAIVEAILDTRYELPSGDKEPLAKSRGNRKLRDLEQLLDAAAEARRQLPRLQSQHNSASALANRLRRTNPGPNPVRVAAQNIALSNATATMVSTAKLISRAEQLLSDEPKIRQDLAAINAVADLARSLDGTSITYKFYTVVGDHEIMLMKGVLELAE